jgi:MFS family permease
VTTQLPGTRETGLPRAAGLWAVTAAFTTLMAFATVPTPLWPLYQARDHFGPISVTVAFTAMVAGTAVTFPTLGHLSDHIGRRRVVVPALLLGIASPLIVGLAPFTAFAASAVAQLALGRAGGCGRGPVVQGRGHHRRRGPQATDLKELAK